MFNPNIPRLRANVHPLDGLLSVGMAAPPPKAFPEWPEKIRQMTPQIGRMIVFERVEDNWVMRDGGRRLKHTKVKSFKGGWIEVSMTPEGLVTIDASNGASMTYALGLNKHNMYTWAQVSSHTGLVSSPHK